MLAKSVTPSRIEENMKVVKLSPQDVASLDEISSNGVKRFVYREYQSRHFLQGMLMSCS